MTEPSWEPVFLDLRWRKIIDERLTEVGLNPMEVGGAVAEAISEVARDRGRHVAISLMRTGPAFLHSTHRDYVRFRARLRDVWGEALDLYEMALVASREAGEIYNEEMEGGGHVDYAPFDALRRLHVRGCLVAAEVYALLADGYPEGAWARWRTLHELSVVAVTIGTEAPSIAERYLDHSVYEAWRDSQVLAGRGLDDEISEREQLAIDLRRLTDQHGAGFRDEWGWAYSIFGRRTTFRMLEERAEELASLRATYREASHYIHGGSGGAARAITEFRGRAEFRVGPTNGFLGEPAINAMRSLEVLTRVLLQSGAPPDVANPAVMSLVTIHAMSEMVARAELEFDRATARLASLESQFRGAESSRAGRWLHVIRLRRLRLRRYRRTAWAVARGWIAMRRLSS